MIFALPLYQPIGATQEQRTELTISEKDLRKGLIEMDPSALDYLRREDFRIKYDNATGMVLKYKLDELVRNWEKSTALSSSVDRKVNDKNFQEIVAYGDKIIPAILMSLRNHPSHLVWALNYITKRTISSKPISVSEASKKWVEWGLANNIIG